jgi:hypothetical protein
MRENNKSNGMLAEPIYVALECETEFEKALSQAISDGLACISTIVAPVLRAYLDDAVTCEIGRMKSRSTIKDIKALEKGLAKMFGFGAKVFEKKILEALYARLSLTLEPQQNLSFLESVKKARAVFDSKTSKTEKSRNSRNRQDSKSNRARKG